MKPGSPYELRLFDRTLATFELETDEFGDLRAHDLWFDEGALRLLPLPFAGERTEASLVDWLESRTIPRNQRFVVQVLERIGAAVGDVRAVLDVSLGLALTDSYWVVPQGFDGTWEQFNLFDNDFDQALGLVAYTGYTDRQKREAGLSSTWTTGGQFAKAWRRVDGRLCLYKAGNDGFANVGDEPFSEYLASQLAAAAGLAHVDYDLEVWHGRLASVCPIFTAPGSALATAWQATKTSSFPEALAAADALGAPMLDAYADMLVWDALIVNQDRHPNNYGYLRDEATGVLIAPAPLFDHNLSLFVWDMEADVPSWSDAGRLRMPCNSRMAYDAQVALVMRPRHHEMLRRLIDFEFADHPACPVPAWRLNALNGFIRQRVRQLLEIAPADDARYADVLEKARARLGALPAVAAGVVVR